MNVAGVPNGAKVLFGEGAGVEVPWDDELRLLETKEILATVDEIREVRCPEQENGRRNSASRR